MSVILSTDNYSFTIDNCDENETQIFNSNTSTTIGGVVKSQADSSRLKIKLTCYIESDDVADFNNVLQDWTEEISYTPSRILYGKSSAEAIKVVLTKSPKVKTFGWNGVLIFQTELELEEVISS